MQTSPTWNAYEAGVVAIHTLDPAIYFGIGIDTALPAPRSAMQRVSPAGSTAVGVFSPSLITVTLALSPLTVITEILPLPFSATSSLPLAARMPSGLLTG